MKSYLKSNVMGNNSLEIQKNSLQAPISQNGQTHSNNSSAICRLGREGLAFFLFNFFKVYHFYIGNYFYLRKVVLCIWIIYFLPLQYYEKKSFEIIKKWTWKYLIN